MCAPAVVVAVATLVVSAAGAYASYRQQENAMEAQSAFQKKRFEDTAANAEASFLAQASQNNLRIGQEAEAAAQAIQQTKKVQAQARSSAVVSAGEAGITGLSLNALTAEFDRTASARTEAIRRNFEFSTQQLGAVGQGLAAQAQGRVIGAIGGPIQGPSLAGAALKIAGAAGDSYDFYRRNSVNPSNPVVSGHDTDPGGNF